ncbi:thioredoxin family protein [Levilactobacillus brevis]|uniref:Thioredoxin family protein n=1 Tax=Levilactobacillus brevis TaxID=1580 RepID=A0AA41JUJ4_LEVBR|nr:thioredoxin family protein [Levilactobacillus brevis]MBS0948632.1 thioredoxin family protein [Levilactobacillus brevis]MBS1007245.1 thioredoxin family protein [Levilactobacillus brevis]MBS1011693.1 thioredoxin family protein [Levilactobacillus brevis]
MKKRRLKRWQVVTLIAGSVIVMGFLTGILVRNRVENKAYVESSPVTIQRTLSRKNSRRIVLLFYRPSCRYCQQIKRQVNRNEDQVNSSRQKETGVFLKVRTTNPANIRVLDRYQVESTPTFMVIKNGQVLKQYSGTNPTKIDQLMLRGDAK